MVSRRILARLAAVFAIPGTLVAGILASNSIASAAAPQAVVVAAPANAYVSPSQQVTIEAQVSNTSAKKLGNGSLVISTESTMLATSSEVTTWLSKKSGGPLPGKTVGSVAVPALGAKATANVTVTFPAAALAEPTKWGVRGISVSYQINGATIEFARTTVILNAGSAPASVRVATILPLVSPPSALGLATSSELESATGPMGYLSEAMTVANNQIVTLAVDPRLTTSILTLGNQSPASARDWLAQLNAKDREGFWLTYGDSDVAGQLQSGASSPATPSLSDLPNIPSATQNQDSATSVSWPGWAANLTGVVWPRANSLANGDLRLLAKSAFDHALISSGNISTAVPRNAHASVEGVNSLVIGDEISRCLSAAQRALTPLDREAGSTCAASLLAAAVTSNSQESTVVIGLDRSVSLNQFPETLNSALESITRYSWVRPITAAEAFLSTASNPALLSERESANRIAKIKKVLGNQELVQNYSAVAATPDAVTNPGVRREASVLSNAWLTSADWEAGLVANNSLTEDVLNSVSIVTSSTINMVGGQARIPVVIRNDLASPVTVVLHAEPSNARLIVERETSLTIEQDSQNRAYIPVSARVGSGSVDLTISLTDSLGTPIGSARVIPVRVRADWEAWGLVGIGVIFTGLVIAGVIRTVRKRKVREQ